MMKIPVTHPERFQISNLKFEIPVPDRPNPSRSIMLSPNPTS